MSAWPGIIIMTVGVAIIATGSYGVFFKNSLFLGILGLFTASCGILVVVAGVIAILGLC